MADWLINYTDGFVRRGLSGAVLLPLAEWTGIAAPLLVWAVKALAYLVLYGVLATFMVRKDLSLAEMLLVLSPLAAMFPLMDFQGAGRKETLLLAVFAVWMLKPVATRNAAMAGGALLGVTMLLHEGLIFFVPMILAAIALSGERQRAILTYWPWLAVPPLAVFGGVVLWGMVRGDVDLMAICGAIDPAEAKRWCKWDGAIGYLETSPGQAVWDVVAKMSLKGWVSFILALPLLAIHAWVLRGRYVMTPKVWGIAAVLAASQIPLFVLAWDWGRWLAVDGMLLTLAYLGGREDLRWPRGKAMRPALAVAALAAYVVLISTVNVRHCCTNGLGLAPKPFAWIYEFNR